MKITGIWTKEDKNQDPMLTIKTEDGKLLNAIRNARKTEENQPDFRIMDFSQTTEEGYPVSVGAAWFGVTKKNTPCLKMRIGEEYHTAFTNRRAKGDKSPDLVVLG